MERRRIGQQLELVFESKSDQAEWFGYYNYGVLNADQTKMLCNRADVDGVAVEKGMSIELGYYDIVSGDWHHIGTSDSWNWQQGAMLQWLPRQKEDIAIYNSSQNGRLIAKIHNTTTGEERVINWPIYGITPDGKKSISIELERSYWCRAYHYMSVANPAMDGRVLDSDGIFEIDLEQNTRKRIISIQDIIACDYDSEFEKMKHWLEHVMISPSGKRFCFLHRFSPIDNVYDYTTRVCIANIDGTNLQVVSGWKKYNWSHFWWITDDEFVIYTYENSRFGKLKSLHEIISEKPLSLKKLTQRVSLNLSYKLPMPLGKLFGRGDSYYQYYTLSEEGLFRLKGKWANKHFRIDGHPSFSVGGEFMITDTYPDKKGFQHLYRFNVKTHKLDDMAQLYAAFSGNSASCDLHPKVSKNNFIAVDTAYDGRHHLLLFRSR